MSGPPVLVTYGTKNGSTAGIAEMIAVALRREDIDTEVRPAAQVHDVSGYSAVILGGALYAGRWHRDARTIARRQAKALRELPVWLFSSGPLDSSADAGAIPPTRQVAKIMDEVGARGHVTFGGRLDSQAKGFIARSMVRNGHGGDFRNDKQIGEWSRAISAELKTSAVSR